MTLFHFSGNYRKLKYCLTTRCSGRGGSLLIFCTVDSINKKKLTNGNGNGNLVPISTINIKPKGSTNKHNKREIEREREGKKKEE